MEFFGFHGFWKTGSEIRCASPDGDNNTAISIRLDEDDLFASSYESIKTYHGDILGLFEEYSDLKFGNIMYELHNLFGLNNDYKKTKQKVDLLAELRGFKSRKSKSADISNEKFGIEVLDRFIAKNHVSMIEEAISPKVLRQFNVMFDPVKSRIIMPHFDWYEHDKIVGIKGRTTMDAIVAKELGVPKYWNYIKGYKKTGNLYGYNLAKDNVREANMLIIFESEKSVLKHFTIEMGKGFSVAVGGHELSDTQIKFIVQNTDPDTEVVIAFDKDIMIGDEDTDGKVFLEELCKKISKYRRTSYIYDTHNIIGDKDAPIDCGLKRWKHLLKYRVRVM